MRILTLSLLLLFCANSFAALDATFEKDDRLPLVYVTVALKTGAASDPKGKEGLTSFLARMLLRGTRTLTKRQIDEKLDQLGGRIGVDTRTEAAVIRGAVLSKNIQPFLDIISDIVLNPSFPRSEIRKLKAEVRSELLASLANDQYVASEHFKAFLFRNHPYGRPIDGTPDIVATFSRRDLQKHYREILDRDRLIFVGTGNMPVSAFKNWAQKIVIKTPSGTGSFAYNGPNNFDHRRLLIVDKPNRNQTQIFFGMVGVHMTNKDYFPLYVGNYAFGGGSLLARLNKEVRDKRGWSYNSYSYFQHASLPHSWRVWLFPSSSVTPEALSLTLKMVEDLREKGITKEEFEFAKESLVNAAAFDNDTPQKRVANTLIEKVTGLPEGFMRDFSNKIKKVTYKQVNQALAHYLEPNRLAITVLGTAKDLKDPLIKAAHVKMDDLEVVPFNKPYKQ